MGRSAQIKSPSPALAKDGQEAKSFHGMYLCFQPSNGKGKKNMPNKVPVLHILETTKTE